jgi:3-oxoacyl-[acyl-carrier protein] reductase
MTSLKGKSILLTGGGSGIGEGCATYFAAQGALVTISGRREDRIKAVAQAIGPNCTYVVGDVTSEADRPRMIAAAVAHGGGKLDALVNNAGVTVHGSLSEQKAGPMLDVLNTNLVAPMLLTALAVPELERTQGAVIFIGSVHTRLAMPGRLAYAASKSGVQTISRVLAAELGPKKIRVNCVIPGAVPSEINVGPTGQDVTTAKAFFHKLAYLHPIGRIGSPEDIAQAMEYLINADWTTGAVLDVDGGMGLGATKL